MNKRANVVLFSTSTFPASYYSGSKPRPSRCHFLQDIAAQAFTHLRSQSSELLCSSYIEIVARYMSAYQEKHTSTTFFSILYCMNCIWSLISIILLSAHRRCSQTFSEQMIIYPISVCWLITDCPPAPQYTIKIGRYGLVHPLNETASSVLPVVLVK